MNVSVIIPAYKATDTIYETLDSVEAARQEAGCAHQLEVLVIDDGSPSHELRHVVTHPSHPRYFRRLMNGGVSAARNTGIDLARYNWLYTLDADNLLDPASFVDVLDKGESQEWDIVAPAEIRAFSETEEPHALWPAWEWGQITLDDLWRTHASPVCSGNYLFSREIWLRAGKYPEFARTLDSWGFGLRCLMEGAEFGVCQGTFYLHRYSTSSNWSVETEASRGDACARLVGPYWDRVPKHLKVGSKRSVFMRIGGSDDANLLHYLGEL